MMSARGRCSFTMTRSTSARTSIRSARWGRASLPGTSFPTGRRCGSGRWSTGNFARMRWSASSLPSSGGDRVAQLHHHPRTGRHPFDRHACRLRYLSGAAPLPPARGRGNRVSHRHRRAHECRRRRDGPDPAETLTWLPRGSRLFWPSRVQRRGRRMRFSRGAPADRAALRRPRPGRIR